MAHGSWFIVSGKVIAARDMNHGGAPPPCKFNLLPAQGVFKRNNKMQYNRRAKRAEKNPGCFPKKIQWNTINPSAAREARRENMEFPKEYNKIQYDRRAKRAEKIPGCFPKEIQ